MRLRCATADWFGLPKPHCSSPQPRPLPPWPGTRGAGTAWRCVVIEPSARQRGADTPASASRSGMAIRIVHRPGPSHCVTQRHRRRVVSRTPSTRVCVCSRPLERTRDMTDNHHAIFAGRSVHRTAPREGRDSADGSTNARRGAESRRGGCVVSSSRLLLCHAMLCDNHRNRQGSSTMRLMPEQSICLRLILQRCGLRVADDANGARASPSRGRQ